MSSVLSSVLASAEVLLSSGCADDAGGSGSGRPGIGEGSGDGGGDGGRDGSVGSDSDGRICEPPDDLEIGPFDPFVAGCEETADLLAQTRSLWNPGVDDVNVLQIEIAAASPAERAEWSFESSCDDGTLDVAGCGTCELAVTWTPAVDRPARTSSVAYLRFIVESAGPLQGLQIDLCGLHHLCPGAPDSCDP